MTAPARVVHHGGTETRRKHRDMKTQKRNNSTASGCGFSPDCSCVSAFHGLLRTANVGFRRVMRRILPQSTPSPRRWCPVRVVSAISAVSAVQAFLFGCGRRPPCTTKVRLLRAPRWFSGWLFLTQARTFSCGRRPRQASVVKDCTDNPGEIVHQPLFQVPGGRSANGVVHVRPPDARSEVALSHRGYLLLSLASGRARSACIIWLAGKNIRKRLAKNTCNTKRNECPT